MTSVPQIHIHTHATGLPTARASEQPGQSSSMPVTTQAVRHGSAELSSGPQTLAMEVISVPPTRPSTPRGDSAHKRAREATAEEGEDDAPPVLPGISKRLLTCENQIHRFSESNAAAVSELQAVVRDVVKHLKEVDDRVEKLDQRVTHGGSQLESHLEA